MPNNKNKRETCILFMTHKANSPTLEAAQTLYNSCHEHYDIFILLDERAKADTGEDSETKIPTQLFSIQSLRRSYNLFRNSTPPDLTPGNVIFPLLDFSHHHYYENYWLVEYDVRFTGEWIDFFQQFDDDPSDLLGTSLHDHSHKPSWFWWSSLRTPIFRITRKKDLVRGFFPVLRVTKGALEAFERATRRGWNGHYEVVLPTVLRKQGFTISDIGGNGEFTPNERIGQNYINSTERKNLAPGTFVCPPAHPVDEWIPDMLYHAIKT